MYPPIERTMLTIIAAMAKKRFIVRAEEKLTAFLELEAAIRELGATHSPSLSARLLSDRSEVREIRCYE